MSHTIYVTFFVPCDESVQCVCYLLNQHILQYESLRWNAKTTFFDHECGRRVDSRALCNFLSFIFMVNQIKLYPKYAILFLSSSILKKYDFIFRLIINNIDCISINQFGWQYCYLQRQKDLSCLMPILWTYGTIQFQA